MPVSSAIVIVILFHPPEKILIGNYNNNECSLQYESDLVARQLLVTYSWHQAFLFRFSMPYTPLQQLKPDRLTGMFGEFNFDELDSDDEVPEQEQRR